MKRTRESPSQTISASLKLSSRACNAGVSSSAESISPDALTEERMPIRSGAKKPSSLMLLCSWM